ncbi:MAG: hypothetical protein JWR26_3405 [Pedosphaera sp.]|nr:hypothetical protein [Pedosphaera sp.]
MLFREWLAITLISGYCGCRDIARKLLTTHFWPHPNDLVNYTHIIGGGGILAGSAVIGANEIRKEQNPPSN